jgi:hypothetical protein
MVTALDLSLAEDPQAVGGSNLMNDAASKPFTMSFREGTLIPMVSPFSSYGAAGPCAETSPADPWRTVPQPDGTDDAHSNKCSFLGMRLRTTSSAIADLWQRRHDRLRTAGIRDKPTALASPWQNGFAERLIGSIGVSVSTTSLSWARCICVGS